MSKGLEKEASAYSRLYIIQCIHIHVERKRDKSKSKNNDLILKFGCHLTEPGKTLSLQHFFSIINIKVFL